jgi:hypothetical protein
MTKTGYEPDWEVMFALANEHERDCAKALIGRGWAVSPFGREWMGETSRALARTNSVLRWTPDLLAVRGDNIVLVDAKRGSLEGFRNVTIQSNVVWAGEAWSTIAPVYYIYPTGLTFSWQDIVTHVLEERLMVRTDGTGSGTPYYLIPQELGRAMDDCWGRPIRPTGLGY